MCFASCSKQSLEAQAELMSGLTEEVPNVVYVPLEIHCIHVIV